MSVFMFLAGIGTAVAVTGWLYLHRRVVLGLPIAARTPEEGGVYAVRMVSSTEQNPHHYRVTSFWRVVERSGDHVVVERVGGDVLDRVLGVDALPRRELWVTDHHAWSDAKPLREALNRGPKIQSIAA
jgi:hypothetical protein